MAGFTNLMLAAALFISIPAILALVPGVFYKSISLVIAVVALFSVFRADKQRKRIDDVERAANNELRLAELGKLANSNNFKLEISYSNLLFFALLSGVFGALLIVYWTAKGNAAYLISGILFIVYSLSKIINQIRTLAKPFLTITQHGISVGNFDAILWDEIGSIDLREWKHRGMTLFHMLVLDVTNSKRVTETRSRIANLIYRLGFSPATKVAFILKSNSEPPEVVFRFCMFLWSRAREERV